MSEISYDVQHIPINKIYADDTFNCRGNIAPLDVNDLVVSIKNDGLQFPITVQPRSDVKGFIPENYDWRIVAGHRRYMAVKILGKERIPCMVRRNLDETQAKILNLSENFHRKDLNILQEARALQSLYEAGIAREYVAKAIGKSTSWVQVRFNLLSLPEEIQQEAAAGLINQYQIKELFSLETTDEQYEAVRKLKDAKMRGEKIKVGKKRKVPTTKKKERTREELFQMVEIIGKNIGFNITTRVLAWAAGEISTAEVFSDIQKLNPEFFPPIEF